MNPFTLILNDLQLQNPDSGPAGVIHLLCCLGRDNYGGTITATQNPYSEVKRLLVASAGRETLEYQAIAPTLTSAEIRWASRH